MALPTFFTFFVRKDLSMVMIWDTLTTDALGRPDCLAVRSVFPGASESLTFDVRTAAITVDIRLALKLSDCTTRTGRL
jgi:hypothetical protein